MSSRQPPMDGQFEILGTVIAAEVAFAPNSLVRLRLALSTEDRSSGITVDMSAWDAVKIANELRAKAQEQAKGIIDYVSGTE